MKMVCCTAETSFGCVYDVVMIAGGGGGVVLVRAFCVCEMEYHGGEVIYVAFGEGGCGDLG